MRALVSILALLFTPYPRCAAEASPTPPALRPGALELGISGAFASIEGSRQADIGTRAGTFFAAGSGLFGAEAELAYTRVGDLDALDLLANLSWAPLASWRPTYAFVSITAGLRQEWLGSFRQRRHPLGGGIGVRHLVGERVALRADYRAWRVLNDPVANFNEQRLLIGVSVLLRNGARGRGN